MGDGLVLGLTVISVEGSFQTLLGCVPFRQRSGNFQDDVSPWCIVLEINKISLFQKKVKMVSQDVWCCIFSCVRNMGLWIRFIDVINKTMLALLWHPYPSEDSFVIICYNFNKSLLIKYHFFLHERSYIGLIYYGKLKIYMCVNLYDDSWIMILRYTGIWIV